MHCEVCGAAHGPWGTHGGRGATVYEMWVSETGSVRSALTVNPAAGASEPDARSRFARQLDRFVAVEPPSVLRAPAVVLHLEFDADAESEPGYGPLGAPERLHRSVGELIELALADLPRGP